MTRIRRINVSQVEGGTADNTDTNEIRPFGETAFYLDENGPADKLTLMMFNGTRTHLKSKVLSPGVLYGSDADSGDGNNYDTIKLIPDAALHSNGSNQYLIVDPTAPNHIHIRAGGTIDDSNAALILGGENSNVEIQAGSNPPVYVRANSNTWMFDTNGSLLFPGSSNARIGEDEPGLVITSGTGFAVLTNANIVNTYEVEFIGYVSNGFGDSAGATLTVTEIIAGTITDGMTIYGAGLPPEGWAVTFGGVMEPQGTGGTGNYLLSGANILTVSQSFNDGVNAAGSNAWVFESNGDLTFPNGGVIRTDGSNLEVGGMANFNVEATGVVNIYTDNGSHQWQFGDDGDLSLPSNGVIKSSTYGGFSLRSRHDEPIDNLVGSNILISPGQVSINYQVEDQGVPTPGYQWDFNYTTRALDLADGGLKFADNTVQTTAYVSDKVSGEWTVAPGTANYSFTVPINGVYQLWVRANIPNGIVSYVATAAVTNANVPVLGTQYAWNYTAAGDPILFTALPTQFVGTEGAISTANPASGTTTNTFVFGLANSTTENITVAYGYTKIS